MKIIKIVLLLLVSILIIWIDLPENLRIKFNLGKQKFDFLIHPLSFDIKIGSWRIRKEFKTYLGLDLRGGSHLVFEANTQKVDSKDLQDSLISARDIIERRVNLFGVSEPVVQTIKSGNQYRITVDLPGVAKVADAIKLIGQTAQLSFKEEASTEAKIATDTPIFLRLTKETGLTGKHVKNANVVFDPNTGQPQVGLNFSKEGARIFREVTQRNVGKPVGIYIDEFLISAPTVQQAITEGNAVITGNFTIDEAKKLAIAINSGALPLPIKLVEQRNVGPTLGKIEVTKSVFAGAIGLTLVLIFIFERIKEELRRGNDLDIAIRLGFGRAIDAIKDANITTLIVSFILFNPLNWEFLPQFGLVRGFALTLAIGVATSLFTGVVITKRLINFFHKND